MLLEVLKIFGSDTAGRCS